MKKLIILVVIILVTGLFAGCDFFDWLFPDEKLITITWFEDAERYNADGTFHSRWYGNELGPATLIQDGDGWCFADVKEYYNNPEIDYKGIVFITEARLLSGHATYFWNLPTEDIFIGQVEIVVYEDGTSGTMVGTYTQNTYKFVYDEEDMAILEEKYLGAIQCADNEDKWFIGHTDYTAYPR